MSDGGAKERPKGGWEERCKQNALFPALVFYTLHRPQKCHLHTQLVPPPALWGHFRSSLVCSVLLYETWLYGKLLESDCPPWYLSFEQKDPFWQEWEGHQLEKTSFCPHKMLLGDAVWMSVLWTITGIHRTARYGWKPWENANAGTMMFEALGWPPHHWTCRQPSEPLHGLA